MEMHALKAKVRTALRIGTALSGVDPLQVVRRARGLRRFVQTARLYRAQDDNRRFPLRVSNLYPIVDEFMEQAGSASGHYFHQDLWAARKVYERKPLRHVDVGSRIDGFVSHLLVFMPVEVVDVRPLNSYVEGLTFVRADATDMRTFGSGTLESVSSLHAVEHFGLGRYGDPIDTCGWFRAMNSLERVLKPGGRLYFSVPIGRERVEFNAHRVLAPETILGVFSQLKLVSFSAVDDSGAFHADATPRAFDGADYACGLFEFTK